MKRIIFLLSVFLVSIHAQQYDAQPNRRCCEWVCHCNGDCCLDGGCQAYNIPSAPRLDCSWGNLIGSVSWIYWHASEEGLDFATTAAYDPTESAVSPIVSGGISKTVYPNFDYHSGFKIGVGSVFGCDSWIWKLDWTCFHHKTNTSVTAPSLSGGFVGALFTTNWFYQTTSGVIIQSPAGEKIKTSWDLDLDWIDLTLSRPFYEGMCVTVNPFAGLRASLINQSFKVRLEDLLNIAPPSASIVSHNHSHSWAIGPRAGFDTHYLLGMGFRLQAEFGGSLLYTRYTKIAHSEDTITSGGANVKFKSAPIGLLRPMFEGSLGFGWGFCPEAKNWHLDIIATYDFNYLWSQNQMRASNDLIFIGTSGSPADLHLHGLTLTATVQF